ncbi:hypothetical protein [Candidatus Magnetominusculus dajiuhuensis]|uniref:hypothetical protein n=1 Tax=Candidatus Magnetominusculus dajiuhuensis TaxID=3137712 RepID=UPI003B434738
MKIENFDYGCYENFLNTIEIGKVQVHKNLAIYPLYSPLAKEHGFALLDEVIGTTSFTIREVRHGSDSFPHPLTKNSYMKKRMRHE